MLDGYVDFGLTELLVPMASSWQPGAVAWGVAGLYLLLAVEITSLLRNRIPRQLWKVTHMLSFLLFAASTAHGVLAGSDATGVPADSAIMGGGLCAVPAAVVPVRRPATAP